MSLWITYFWGTTQNVPVSICSGPKGEFPRMSGSLTRTVRLSKHVSSYPHTQRPYGSSLSSQDSNSILFKEPSKNSLPFQFIHKPSLSITHKHLPLNLKVSHFHTFTTWSPPLQQVLQTSHIGFPFFTVHSLPCLLLRLSPSCPISQPWHIPPIIPQ